MIEMKVLGRAAIPTSPLVAVPHKEARIVRNRTCRVRSANGHGGSGAPDSRRVSQAQRFWPPMDAMYHNFTPANVAKSSVARLRFLSRIVFCGWPAFNS